MNKLLALLDLFRKGSTVADPAFWKRRQIEGTALAPLLGALAVALKSFGVEVPLDEVQIVALSGGIVVVINLVLTFTTTDKIGLPAKSDGAGAVPVQPARRADDADVFHTNGG